jgi:hypothetical protein
MSNKIYTISPLATLSKIIKHYQKNNVLGHKTNSFNRRRVSRNACTLGSYEALFSKTQLKIDEFKRQIIEEDYKKYLLRTLYF